MSWPGQLGRSEGRRRTPFQGSKVLEVVKAWQMSVAARNIFTSRCWFGRLTARTLVPWYRNHLAPTLCSFRVPSWTVLSVPDRHVWTHPAWHQHQKASRWNPLTVGRRATSDDLLTFPKQWQCHTLALVEQKHGFRMTSRPIRMIIEVYAIFHVLSDTKIW